MPATYRSLSKHLWTAFVIFGTPFVASAQRLNVRLTDAASGTPLAGALVRVVRDDGVSEPERLSNAAGRATLATSPGVVRVLVRRIGYRPFTSSPVTLATDEIRELELAVPGVRITLPRVAVTETARDCEDGMGRVSGTDLWQSIGAALAASQVTSNDTSVHTSIETFERDLDQFGHVRSESHRPLGVTGARPFDTPEPEVLSRDGYVVVHGAAVDYYAPDARVLLSPEFANDHCFGIVAGSGSRAGLIGASFAPVRGRRTADVRGTLWVDTATAELRVLEYQYVNTGRGLSRIDSLGGRLSFERLPSGDWIVDHWEIRMATFRNGAWNGYRVVGSDARLAKLAVRAATASSIVGIVYDSVHAMPLAGARIGLLGKSNETLTDSSGNFRLDSVAPGPAIVTAQHALLDSLGLQGIARAVQVDSGAEVNVALATPSYATLWHRACGRGWAPPTTADSGFVYGTVTDALTGARMAGASVAVAWIDPHWNPSDTAHARAWRIAAKTDSIGTYAVCGLPTDVAARVNAFVDERATDRLDLAFAGQRMIRRDLSIGPADTARSGGPRGVIVGTVRDSAGRPYPDARVLVTGAPEVRTDPDGRFVIRGALPGSRELQARAIGAAPMLVPIEVPANDTAAAEVTLEHVTVLSTVEVNELRTTARRVAEYAHRRRLGIGYAADSTEMQGKPSMAAVFFNFPATRVQFLHGLDIAVWFNNPKGGSCQATVWIDGRKADFEEFNFYRPADLAAVEVFPSGAQLPGEFRSFDDLCGAIVVWTKNAFR